MPKQSNQLTAKVRPGLVVFGLLVITLKIGAVVKHESNLKSLQRVLPFAQPISVKVPVVNSLETRAELTVIARRTELEMQSAEDQTILYVAAVLGAATMFIRRGQA